MTHTQIHGPRDLVQGPQRSPLRLIHPQPLTQPADNRRAQHWAAENWDTLKHLRAEQGDSKHWQKKTWQSLRAAGTS